MASTVQAVPKQLNKRDRRMQSSPDESALVKQVRETHNPTPHFLDVRPTFHISTDILRQTSFTVDALIKEQHDRIETLDDKTSFAGFDGLLEDLLSHLLHKISCEIFCKCSSSDLHESTMSLLKMLSNYPWEAKVVLCVAAFSANYGELWLVAILCKTNPLAKLVAYLKQISDIIDYNKTLRNQLDALQKLIESIINVTRRVVEFHELPSEYLSLDLPPISVAKAYIPAATYWIIRSIVACGSHVTSLPGMKQEYIASTEEVWELSNLSYKLLSIYEHLGNEIDLCNKFIRERIYEEEFDELFHLIVKSGHLHDKLMKILRALLCPKDDQHPFVIGSDKTRINIEVLRKKHVLLLISDLSISDDELKVLFNLYAMRNQFHGHEYEVVWVPVVDTSTGLTEKHQVEYAIMQAKMPWYSVHDLRIEPHVIKFIKQEWNFHKKMIIVSLDHLGQIVSKNALHMLWIWGNLAFPFSNEKEASLWNAESWGLQLLVDGIDADILKRIEDGRYICLYGSEDIGWIREFTKTAKLVAKALDIKLELVYVGKGNITKERQNKISIIIVAEKLSEVWIDPTSSWFFWSRLESMRCSKAKQHKTVDNDYIMKEVMTLLSYDGSDLGWVLLWKGSTEMTRANGKLALLTLKEFETWRMRAEETNLLNAFGEESRNRHTKEHCTRLILPGIDGEIPEKVVCTECSNEMEKYYFYRCCSD